MKLVLIVLALLLSLGSFAQSIKGQVLQNETGESLPTASVYIEEIGAGAICDEHGHFVIKGVFPDSVKALVKSSTFESKHVFLKPGEMNIVKLDIAHVQIAEVQVLREPLGTMEGENAMYIATRKLDEIQLFPGRLGEALANVPGVYQSSTGPGISKPVIRGFQGTRILTLWNGLRLDNQQWGSDHGMAATSLGVSEVEVLKGPASITYGADALGGVLYFKDENPAMRHTQDLKVSTQFESVTMGTTSRLGYRVTKEKLAIGVYGSYANHADYQLPSGQYAANSRFNEAAGKGFLQYNNKDWYIQVRYFYSRNRIGIPGHTHDSIINPAEFQIDNQSRAQIIPAQITNNHFVSIKNSWNKRRGTIDWTLGWTHSSLREFEDKVTIPALALNLNNTMYNLKFKSRSNSRFSYVVGAQGTGQMNRGKRAWQNPLLPNFNQIDNGAYAMGRFKFNAFGSWLIQAGARYDNRFLDVFNSDLVGDFSRVFHSANGSLGIVYKWGWKTGIKFNASTGFRTPHVSELASNGTHHGALRFEIGNPDLIQERAVQFDLAYDQGLEHFKLLVNPFYSIVENYIYANPMDSLVEGYPAFTYEQADLVEIYGIDLGFHYHPHFAHWLHIESSYSHLVAEQRNGDDLPLMPANRVNSTLRFMIKDLFKGKFAVKDVNIQHLYMFEQNRVAANETTSPDYNIINAGVNMVYGKSSQFELGLGVKNLLNEQYIDHLSRLKNISLPSPGRNLYVQLTYHFNKKLKSHNPDEDMRVIEVLSK